MTVEWVLGITGTIATGVIWLINERKNRRIEKLTIIEAETQRLEIKLKNEQHGKEHELKDRAISIIEDGLRAAKMDIEMLKDFKEKSNDRMYEIKLTLETLNNALETIKHVLRDDPRIPTPNK